MKIYPIDPDLLPFKALKFLDDAIKRTPANDTTLSDILEQARRDKGSFLLFEDQEIVGASYIQVYPNCLNIVLLSCDDALKYKQEITDFFKSLMDQLRVENLLVVGRVGWNRLFNDLTPEGTIYSYKRG